MTKKLDVNHILEQVKLLAGELGRPPFFVEFHKRVKLDAHQVRRWFGNYEKLLLSAGVNPSQMETPYVLPTIITPPLIPPDDIPIEKILESMCERFSKRSENSEAKKWMEFKVDSDQPIGICWFGDPHIDDDGCNLPLLLEHIEICKTTEGMFGANIGDVHNNWVGRLMAEYANQSTSRGTAFQLIEWFFKDSGVNWLIMLLGNHDSWNFGHEALAQITKHICPLIDWRAQFKLTFKNGRECLIDAAHDHSGHSQWNSLHGQQKASTMGGIAHLYMAGHKHNWALAQHECPQTNRVYWLARARGYKYIDSYADRLGFGAQKSGASIVTVIDPKASPLNFVRCFSDPKEGADYLNFLRKRK